MRRLLAWISIISAVGAFTLFALIFVLHVNIIIPIMLFAVALVLLYIVKRMPGDDTGISKSRPNDAAFYDNEDPADASDKRGGAAMSRSKKNGR